jgi:4-hydroxybenzoate polyprenyltransferase
MRGVAGQELASLAILVVANVLLVSHVFMLNDWSGLHADLADPNKASRVFTTRGVGRGEMGALTAAILVLSLVLFGVLGAVTLGLAAGIAALSALYSLPLFNWKGRPLLNSAAHVAGGILHFLLGYSIAHAIDLRGVAVASFFALIFVAGHLTQEVRDHQGDADSGIRTNAVAFGPRQTFVASLVLFTMAHAILLALAISGLLPRLLGALVVLFAIQLAWSLKAFREGLTFASVSKLQSRYRVLYALIGVAMIAGLILPLL